MKGDVVNWLVFPVMLTVISLPGFEASMSYELVIVGSPANEPGFVHVTALQSRVTALSRVQAKALRISSSRIRVSMAVMATLK
jgi:hypothetical protein